MSVSRGKPEELGVTRKAGSRRVSQEVLPCAWQIGALLGVAKPGVYPVREIGVTMIRGLHSPILSELPPPPPGKTGWPPDFKDR